MYLTVEFRNGVIKQNRPKEQCNCHASQLFQKGSEPKTLNFLTLQISYSSRVVLATELPEHFLEMQGHTREPDPLTRNLDLIPFMLSVCCFNST